MNAAVGLLSVLLAASAPQAGPSMVDRLVEDLGQVPALVVVVCCGESEEQRTLGEVLQRTPWTVLCRTADAAVAQRLRDWASTNGWLGRRLYVVEDAGPSLRLADDVASGSGVLVRGAVADTADGLVVLHQQSVEGVTADGKSQWQVPLPAPPVRWGLPLAGRYCVVTLADGLVVCVQLA